MGWAAIITFIVQTFGPILAEWLKKWLDNLLNRTAANMPEAATYGSESAARGALFDEAIASLRWFHFGKRALLRSMKRHADQGTLDVAELKDLAGAAESE